ncbi:OsmC family protein [Roseateles amylovorans]|uniref:OsmC family protein n=1 Tax=Roseateles amylovorans TaxID=2978473 RepID=A0ABY6B1G8_9BURK|nr:OsmC family protein [Roseateles amylovorans]UXH79247.1 OsmC family protein [Roseateles amylovorans]
MAHTYTAEIIWERGGRKFSDNLYSRKHTLRFDGGISIPGSSSPLVVPLPYSEPNAVDPEEALVSAISSCHMLWLLSIAARNGFIVDSYHDRAVGIMTPNERNKYWVSSVTLHPRILFSGDQMPSKAKIEAMHQEAHDECFIANSVKTDIQIRPQ